MGRPAKYDEATEVKAVRLAVEHRDGRDIKWAAITAYAVITVPSLVVGFADDQMAPPRFCRAVA